MPALPQAMLLRVAVPTQVAVPTLQTAHLRNRAQLQQQPLHRHPYRLPLLQFCCHRQPRYMPLQWQVQLHRRVHRRVHRRAQSSCERTTVRMCWGAASGHARHCCRPSRLPTLQNAQQLRLLQCPLLRFPHTSRRAAQQLQNSSQLEATRSRLLPPARSAALPALRVQAVRTTLCRLLRLTVLRGMHVQLSTRGSRSLLVLLLLLWLLPNGVLGCGKAKLQLVSAQRALRELNAVRRESDAVRQHTRVRSLWVCMRCLRHCSCWPVSTRR